MTFNYVTKQHGASVELYIDRGRDAEDENDLIFNSLYEHKDEIEGSFGDGLSWEPLEAKRACRIAHRMGPAATVTNHAGRRFRRRWSTVWFGSSER